MCICKVYVYVLYVCMYRTTVLENQHTPFYPKLISSVLDYTYLLYYSNSGVFQRPTFIIGLLLFSPPEFPHMFIH